MGRVATEAELAQALDEYVRLLERHLRLEALILFGSYVAGSPDPWSDIDVAVISPEFEGLSLPERQSILSRIPLEHDLRISPIGFPSSEYHNCGPHSFLREVLGTGVVVYPSGVEMPPHHGR